jgi:hypothetical protein
MHYGKGPKTLTELCYATYLWIELYDCNLVNWRHGGVINEFLNSELDSEITVNQGETQIVRILPMGREILVL